VSVNNFQWDGAFSLQNSQGLALNGSPNEEYYTQGQRIFKEEYLRGNFGVINFTIGKQIVNWGKLDGKVDDIVNAEDARDLVGYHQGDYEWRYIGQFMGLLTVRPRSATSISFVWNPDFHASPNGDGAAPGSPYSLVNYTPGAPYTPTITPSGFSHIGQSEEGVRVDNTFGALTVSEIYYYGYSRTPDPVAYDGAYHFTRENKWGLASDYANNTLLHHRFVFRTEYLYTQGVPFATSNPTALNGMVKKDTSLLGGAAETSFGATENRIDLMYEAEWAHTPGVDGARTNQALIHVFDIAHSFRSTSDRLNVEATFFVTKGGSAYGGWAGIYQVGWKFNDYVSASLAYNDYQGGAGVLLNPMNTLAPFGAWSAYKNVQLGMKYEF